MSELTTFTLVPFEPLPDSISLSVTGTLVREGHRLSISYLMTGDVNSVALPALNTTGERQDRLWEQTCFEFFVASGPEKLDLSPYWEFNLSPNGAWNVFALDGYRDGLREDPTFSSLSFSVSQSSEGVRLAAEIDLSGLALADSPWLFGVCMVCVLATGEETFWAIAHPRSEADFHSAGSFVLKLTR